MESNVHTETAPAKTADEERYFLSQGQGDRFDRWIEFLSAVVLSLATVLTAWCGYQAALWGGEQARYYSLASATRIMAAQNENEALLRSTMHVGLFVEYASAISQENQLLADFLYDRFPAELRSATDAWLATKPLQNPDAPGSPFEMPEYVVPQSVEAQAQYAEATDLGQQADHANDVGDTYVLVTVAFATVLFFSGIAGKFQWRVIDAAMLVLSVLTMIWGIVRMVGLPMM